MCTFFRAMGTTFIDLFPVVVYLSVSFMDYSFCEKDHLTSQKEFFMYGQTSFSNTRIITRQTAHRYATVNTKIPSNVTGIASEAFQKKNGSLICKELKGVETGCPLRSCGDCIADAAEIVEQILFAEE